MKAKVVRWFFLAVVATSATFPRAGFCQEWGFSNEFGSVLTVERSPDLSLSGKLAIPKLGGYKELDVTGRNEPGILTLDFTDPTSNSVSTYAYVRSKSPGGGYVNWVASDNSVPPEFSKFSAPINFTDGPANAVLERWRGDQRKLVPVQDYIELMRFKSELEKASFGSVAADKSIGIVSDTAKVAAWDAAFNLASAEIQARRTFTDDTPGIIFTAHTSDVAAVLNAGDMPPGEASSDMVQRGLRSAHVIIQDDELDALNVSIEYVRDVCS